MAKIRQTPITGPIAGEAATVDANKGTLQLNKACMSELCHTAEILDSNPLSTGVLRPEDFDLPTTTAFIANVHQILLYETGFSIIKRLPVERMSPECTIQF